MLRGYVQWMIKVIHIEKDGALYTSETPTCCKGALYTSESGDNFSLKERIRNKKICWFELFHILKRWSSKRGLEIIGSVGFELLHILKKMVLKERIRNKKIWPIRHLACWCKGILFSHLAKVRIPSALPK